MYRDMRTVSVRHVQWDVTTVPLRASEVGVVAVSLSLKGVASHFWKLKIYTSQNLYLLVSYNMVRFLKVESVFTKFKVELQNLAEN